MTSHQIHALKTLKNGGIVIFPTDTAYGIGCRIDNKKSVDRLFSLRKRPTSKATPILVSSKEEALLYFDSPSDIVRRLITKHWPGALTIVSACQKKMIYSPLRGGGNTVGLRMPNYPELTEVIDALGVPIVGTSANFHGEKTPYSPSELDPALTSQVDYVWKGKTGCGQVSTVVQCIHDSCTILRQGSIVLWKKQTLILHIDTSKTNEITVGLTKDGKKIQKTMTAIVHSSQQTLPLIETVLKDNQVSLSQITDITVHTGPGSFTGLRVGVGIATMLGALFTVPVNGDKNHIIPEITYKNDAFSSTP